MSGWEQNAVFSKLKTSRNWKLEKRFILGHLQPPLDKNSEDLAILVLEFDDVIVSSGPDGCPVGGTNYR